jgi:PAS domain S-box-containing protein
VSFSVSRALDSRWLWRLYLAVGAAGIALYQLAAGRLGVAAYSAIGVYGVAGSLVGARRHASRLALPRLLLTAGVALLVAGDLEWDVEDLLGHTISTPSASDALYLCAYPTLAVGIALLHRRRGRANLIDSVTVTVALATVLWSPLFATFRASEGHGLAERLTLGSYPMWDLLLFFLLARFALGRALQAPWRVLLTLGVGFLFVGDLMWAASAETYALGGWVDSTWLLAYVLVGASALHPSAASLESDNTTADPYAPGRFAILAIPVAALPFVEVVEVLLGHRLSVVDAFLVSGLLLLLLARLGGVVKGLHRARRELAAQNARLNESERRFRQLFAGAPAGMAILAADGRIVSVNAALCAIARTDEDGIVGRDFRDFVDPADRDDYTSRFASLVSTGEVSRVDRRLRAADGGEVWTELSASRLVDEGSELLVVHVQDVTDGRRLQRELAQRNEQLEQADRLKDELISIVSHDLRTPLTSIMGYLELALDDDGGSAAEHRDYLLVAQRNSERLHRLVDDLLFVSRVKSGRAGLELEAADVGRLVRDAVENALPTASSAGIVLASHCDRNVTADVDPHRLTEAIENLLSNALKFTPPGGRVDVRVAGDVDTVTIRVSDTGIGVAEEDLEHLFDRFFRTANAEGVPGAGLGLSIVKAIVDAHGGTIDVASGEGEGTAFALRLPRRSRVAVSAP